MRMTLCLLVLSLTGVADAKKMAPKLTPAEIDAQAWLHVAVETKDPIAEPKQAIAFGISAPTVKECESVASGKAKTPAELAALRTCVAAAWKHFNGGDLSGAELKLAEYLRRFPDATSRAAAKKRAAGLKIVSFVANGDGETMHLDLFVAADHAIRTIDLDSEAVE